MILNFRFCFLLLILATFFALPIFSQSHTVESVIPNWGPPSGGTDFVVKGTNFTNAFVVQIKGITCATTFVDSETLHATSPNMGSHGVHFLRIRNAPTGEIVDYKPHFLAIETVYYVSASDGDDSQDGLTPSTPKKSIQKLIDETIGKLVGAPDGPLEIRLEQGTYKENLWVRKKLVLTGGWSTGFTERDPDQYITILDGDYDDMCARSWGTMAYVAVDGITMINGRRVQSGGGFRSLDDYTTFTNNIIVGNRCGNSGGGVYFSFHDDAFETHISNNIIIGNRTDYHNAGGVAIATYGTEINIPEVAISSNYIIGNKARDKGGGILISPDVFQNDKYQIKNNIIARNKATGGKGGGILFEDEFTIIMEIDLKNNLIMKNDAFDYGGGVAIDGDGDGAYTITQNTITGNRADWLGDGLFVYDTNAATVDIRDSILYFNDGDDIHDGPGTTSVSYSNIEEGFTGTGNISIDPLFVDGPLGDKYLSQLSTGDPDETANSPCLDSGSGTASESVMDSLVTRTDDVADSGTVDMGYHYNVSGLPAPYPSPVIASIIPSGGNFRGGDWVVIRGSGFCKGTEVFFDSEESGDVMVITERKLIAEVPASVGEVRGYVDVEVSNPDDPPKSDTVVDGYRYMDTFPPMWDSTVGIQTATDANDCSIKGIILKWNNASDADSPPVTYNIYRTEEDPWDVEKPIFLPTTKAYLSDPRGWRFATYLNNVSDLTYLDTDISSNTSYWYIVEAIDSENPPNRELNYVISNQSGTEGTTNPYDSTQPESVGNTLLVTTPDHGATIHLDWTAPEGAFKYNIYRGTEASTVDYTGRGPDGQPGVSGVSDDGYYGPDGQPGIAGIDDDNDRYGVDGQPGVADFDDDADGTVDEDDEWCPGGVPYGDDDCSGIDEADEWCPGGIPYGDDDCLTDECDEWCPGGIPYGDDECSNGPDGQPGVAGVDDDLDGTFDEADEFCPGGIPYGDDDCVNNLIGAVEYGYITEWDDTDPAGDILFYKVKATDSCFTECSPPGNEAD